MILVFMFPGQSSRSPGMLERALSLHRGNPALVDAASDALGRDLLRCYTSGHQAMFATDRDRQVGVFLTSHLHLEALRGAGIDTPWSFGSGLGEYNHLVHIGAITFLDALRLVDARGAAFDAQSAYATVAASPFEREALSDVVARVSGRGRLRSANADGPERFAHAGARVDVATGPRPSLAQSARLESVARALHPILAAARWTRPLRPYLPNVLGTFETEPTPLRIAARLRAQIVSRPRWRESAEYLASLEPEARFIEVGARPALHDLGNAGRDPRWYRTDDAEQPLDRFRGLVEELRERA